jgi:hypothetical protein
LYTPQTQLEYSRKQFLQITIASPLGEERRLNSNGTAATAEKLAAYRSARQNRRGAGTVPPDRCRPRNTALPLP